jgi:hypothetical protein
LVAVFRVALHQQQATRAVQAEAAAIVAVRVQAVQAQLIKDLQVARLLVLVQEWLAAAVRAR